MQGPGFTRPAVPGGRSVDLMKLRKPGIGAPMPSMPLMPNQVVFRHKAWLPWWVAVLIPLLLLLALLLFLFLPRNVVVPDVTGTKSAFEAEKKLTKAQLKLAPTPKEKVSSTARARHRDRPDPGRRREGEEGLRGHDRDRGRQRQGAGAGHRRQDAGRSGPDPREGEPATIGQVQPQPPDPKAQDREPDPRRQGGGQGGQADQDLPGHDQGQEERRQGKKENGGGGGGGGGGKAAAVDAARAGRLGGRLPRRRRPTPGSSRSRSPSSRAKKKGTVIRTEPPAGTKLKAGDKVKIVVSGGFPELTYDDGKNILLANGANGKRFPAVAKGPTKDTDPTFSADGTQIAYVANRQRLPQGPVEEGRHRGAAHRARRQVQRPRVGADASTCNVIAMLRDKSPSGDTRTRTSACCR